MKWFLVLGIAIASMACNRGERPVPVDRAEQCKKIGGVWAANENGKNACTCPSDKKKEGNKCVAKEGGAQNGLNTNPVGDEQRMGLPGGLNPEGMNQPSGSGGNDLGARHTVFSSQYVKQSCDTTAVERCVSFGGGCGCYTTYGCWPASDPIVPAQNGQCVSKDATR